MTQFTKLRDGGYQRTLAGRLVRVADRVRDLATKLGVRPYTVTLVRVRWDGGMRGHGSEILVSAEDILPTPKVLLGSSPRGELLRSGWTGTADMMVTEISARYTADQLLGQGTDGLAIPEDEEFFWEIRYQGLDGRGGERRRFLPVGNPDYMATNLCWSVNLLQVDTGRSRNGMLP